MLKTFNQRVYFLQKYLCTMDNCTIKPTMGGHNELIILLIKISKWTMTFRFTRGYHSNLNVISTVLVTVRIVCIVGFVQLRFTRRTSGSSNWVFLTCPSWNCSVVMKWLCIAFFAISAFLSGLAVVGHFLVTKTGQVKTFSTLTILAVTRK